MSEPMGRHPQDDDYEIEPGTAASGRVWPWIVLVLAVALSLAIASFVRRCTDGVTTVLAELSKYNTQPGTDWRDMPVHDAETLLQDFKARPDELAKELTGQSIVITGKLTEIEELEEGTARLYFITKAGDVQCLLGSWSTRSMAALKHIKPDDVLVVGGTVDWMNRNTIAMRSCMLSTAWAQEK